MSSRVVLAAALLTAALAGCAESGAGGPIEIVARPADPLTEPFVFEAKVAAEDFKWDMGDGRTLSGHRVEHVYGVQNGVFLVKLTTTTAGQSTTHDPVRIELGSGANAAPQFELAVEWQWVQVGEPVTFSGAGSADPDGDTLLFSWYCQRASDIAMAGAGHAHGGGGGVQYGTGSANLIPVRLLNGTDVPTADHEVDDLCNGLPAGFQAGPSIRGSFAEAGLYEITMLAKDPAHPAVPGSVYIYVTSTPRQEAFETIPFDGALQYGAPKEADTVLEQAGQQGHLARHDFRIKYPVRSIAFTISDDGGAGAPVDIKYEIRKGTSTKVPETSDDIERGLDFLTPGDYVAIVALRQGAEVGYNLDILVEYETDPTRVFEGPH